MLIICLTDFVISGDFELERHEDDEYYRMEDKWQEEEELRDVLEGLDGHDDDDNDDYEDHRQEDELQEEEGPRDVLQEMFPTDELANKDAIPIDPRLEDYKMAMGGELTVQDVLDQAFADIGNSKLPALRLEDLKPEDFELEWPKWQV